MGYQASTAGTAVTEAYLDEENKQSVMKYASAAARTADAGLTAHLREGMLSYLDDLNVLQVYTGSTWSTVGQVHGALTAWVPTIAQSGAVTKTMNAGSAYQRVGRSVTAACHAAITGPGTASNLITVSLPFAAAHIDGTIVGVGYFIDTSANIFYQGFALLTGGGTAAYFVLSASSGAAETVARVGSSVFTAGLASGDTFSCNLCYQASSDA